MSESVRRRRAFAIALTLGLLALQPASPADTAGLQLTVTVDKASYQPADPIAISLTLTNGGQSPVWVTKRFAISAKEIAPNRRDVFLEITAPSGQLLTSTATYQTGFPKTDYFHLLQSGEHITSEHQPNLRFFFDIKEPGAYQVVAVYENVFGSELGLDVFKGAVRSEPVTFTLTQ